MFYRLNTDGTRQPVHLENAFAGPTRTSCWIICGGPSLNSFPAERIASSPIPKFAVNLAGTGLLRPDFWTSYDPTARFHRSLYLDPGVIKFVHPCRAMDLVPESTFKVCEAPSTFFFDRDRDRGFANFITPGDGDVVDWQDSLLQAIDIAYRLGFRKLFLAGCDMFIRPAPEHIRRAKQAGVAYTPRELLRNFFDRCRKAGLREGELADVVIRGQYHFEETKPLAAAVQTDDHYFRVTQYLRLSRRCIALGGLELISVTPVSRLNDVFEFRPVKKVLREIARELGDPATESTRGRYSAELDRKPRGLGPMRDFRPHFWKSIPNPEPQPAVLPPKAVEPQPLRQALEQIPQFEIPIDELG